MSITLEYARAATQREPWGPLAIWPSRKTLLFLALTFLAAGWVWARHSPWKLVGTAFVMSDTPPLFEPGGKLVTFDQNRGVEIYDPSTLTLTGKIRPFRLNDGRSVFPSIDGSKFMLLESSRSEVAIADTKTLSTKEYRGPLGFGPTLIDASVDTVQMITTEQELERSGMPGSETLVVWDLTQPPQNGVPIKSKAGWALPCRAVGILPYPRQAVISPGGGRIAQWRSYPSGGAILLDAKSLAVLWKEESRQYEVRGLKFLDKDTFCVAKYYAGPLQTLPSGLLDKSGDDLLELRSAIDGRLLNTVRIPETRLSFPVARYAFSADRAVVAYTASHWQMTKLMGVPSAKFISHHNPNPEALFLGTSRRWVGKDNYGTLEIREAGYERPLARLTRNDDPRTAVRAIESPDGNYLVTMGSRLYQHENSPIEVFHRVGGVCRESTFGILGMPHVWLMGTLSAVSGISLWRDGGRRARTLNKRDSGCSAIVIAAAIAALLHWFLAAAIGRYYWTPAPLFLIAGIGLASGARAWRGITFIFLCAAITAGGWWMLKLSAASSLWRIGDRNWLMPKYAAQGAIGALLLICLALLIAIAGRKANPGVSAASPTVL